MIKKIIMIVLIGLFLSSCSGEVPIEKPRIDVASETPVNAIKVDINNGIPWEIVKSKNEEELEKTETIYFVNDKYDIVSDKIDGTISTVYYTEEGLFIEVNLYNGTNEVINDISIGEFSLKEILDDDDILKEIDIIDKVNVGVFENLKLEVGENKLITFTVPELLLVNDIYNFSELSYLIDIKNDN